MISDTRLLTTLAALLKRIRADAVSLSAHTQQRQVFRFAYEAIHQGLVQEHVTITVKVVLNRRVGVASVDTLTPAGLSRCAKTALEIARHAPVQSHLPHLPGPHRIRSTTEAVAATASYGPAACVAAIQRLFHLSHGAGATLAGSLVTGADAFAVVNSTGTSCATASTIAGAKLVTMYRQLSGFSSGVHRHVTQLPLEELLKRSLGQCLHRTAPITLPLGTYEVILEPEAVTDLVMWLGYTAFGAKSVAERTSCLAGRMGEQLMDSCITLYDDGNDPMGLKMPFDFEGTPKQKVLLIDRGKATGMVYDSVYGAQFRHPSTGHAMPPDEVDGPLPLHLAMAPGRDDPSGMIRRCSRGLLIPRFHYVNGLLNPREALMTGLTREGTFLIEKGKLTAPVKTMRFTQSLLEAFRTVRGISASRRCVADPAQELGCAIMPTLHLGAFTFTGRSER